MKRAKKSKYKSVVIKKKRYYFYKITWLDITGDSGHADLHTAEGFMPSVMVTHAYLLNKDKKILERLLVMKRVMSCFQIVMYFQEGVYLKWRRLLFKKFCICNSFFV